MNFLKSIFITLLIPLLLWSTTELTSTTDAKVKKNNPFAFTLTQEEQNWIDTHVVKVGVEPWAPVIFMNDKNKMDGISGEFANKVIKISGLKVEIISGEWKTLLEDFENKKIDFLPDVYKTKKREKFGLFGSGYFKMKDYLFVKENNDEIIGMKSLAGKTLAIQDGNGNIDAIKGRFHKIKLLLTSGAGESIQKVLEGKADALYAGQLIAESIIKDESIRGIKGIYQKSFKPPFLYFMSRIDEPILQSILEKALKSITYAQRQEIISHWINNSKSNIHLNADEKEWLNTHREIRFTGDPNWLPYEAFKDGKHIGIFADYLLEIEDMLGIDFIKIPTKTWSESLELIKTSKANVITKITSTDLDGLLTFTKPILDNKLVLVMENGNDYVADLNSIKNKRFVLLENYSYVSKIQKKYPDIHFDFVKNIDEALNAVSIGKYDAFIATSTFVGYSITNLGINNLKIVGDTELSVKIAWGVTQEYKPLIGILNKALDKISMKQRSALLNSWVQQHTVNKTDWTLIFEIIGVLLLVGAFIIFNNYKLQSLVNEKTSELKELLDSLERKVQERTADLEIAKKEIEATHKHTRDSIEYAALIQGAVIPEANLLDSYFKNYFVHWMPKDTVGGDIWLFDELRNEDECLLFFIDCTGHGVPGAFVTMIVKAVEREIVSKILEDSTMDISPAWVMAYFNRTMKLLLKQETKDSKSNAGWDGGVIYYNKKTQILKFAGAETPLFYTDVDGTFNTVKGNRYSVGYKKCAMDYEYKETILEVEEGMKFYCTTDGYLDQNGGEKGFPFGKKRFSNIIKENHLDTMANQKETFLNAMHDYEIMVENNDRNDDMTVIAFEIGEASKSPDILVYYSGIFTQNIITNTISKLENNIENIGEQTKVLTLAIELTQNIMHYSKELYENNKISQDGSIEVLRTYDGIYSINSQNTISLEDKNIIEPILEDIQTSTHIERRKKYRELRRNGEQNHGKGAGIGFYEVAKLTSSIEYAFDKIDEGNFIFRFKATV